MAFTIVALVVVLLLAGFIVWLVLTGTRQGRPPAESPPEEKRADDERGIEVRSERLDNRR